jgi:hypothetical protein
MTSLDKTCVVPIQNIATMSFNRKSEYLYMVNVVFVQDVIIEKEIEYIVVHTNYLKEAGTYFVVKAARCFNEARSYIGDNKSEEMHEVTKRTISTDFLGSEILIDVDYDAHPIKFFMYRAKNTYSCLTNLKISGISVYLYSYNLGDKVISTFPTQQEIAQSLQPFSAEKWINRHKSFAYSWPLFTAAFERDDVLLDYAAPLGLAVSRLCKSTFKANGYDVSFNFFNGDVMAPYDFEDIELISSGTIHFTIDNMRCSREWLGSSPNLFMVRSKIGRLGVCLTEKILLSGRVEIIISNHSNHNVRLPKKPIQFVPTLEMQAIICNDFVCDNKKGKANSICVAELLFGLPIKYKAKLRDEKIDIC